MANYEENDWTLGTVHQYLNVADFMWPDWITMTQ